MGWGVVEVWGREWCPLCRGESVGTGVYSREGVVKIEERKKVSDEATRGEALNVYAWKREERLISLPGLGGNQDRFCVKKI